MDSGRFLLAITQSLVQLEVWSSSAVLALRMRRRLDNRSSLLSSRIIVALDFFNLFPRNGFVLNFICTPILISKLLLVVAVGEI